MFSRLYFLVLCVVACAELPIEPFFRSDYTYVKSHDAFYKIRGTGERWSEAHTRCAAEKAELAYPRSEDEAKLFATLMSTSLPKNAGFMWVGAHDQFAEGVFQTLGVARILISFNLGDKVSGKTYIVEPILGEDISGLYENWHGGEPNDANFNEDCVSFSKDATLNDENCNRHLPAICWRPGTTVRTSNPICETIDTEYIFDNDGGRCYKIHTKPKNWTQAYGICHAEQSYLVEINSQREANFLVNLIQQYPEYTLKGNFDKVHIAVGFNDLFEEGEYRTSHGKTLQEAGYDEWYTYQPDDHQGNEDCGSIFRNGKLNDINCDCRMMFICEKEVGDLYLDDRFQVGGSRATNVSLIEHKKPKTK